MIPLFHAFVRDEPPSTRDTKFCHDNQTRVLVAAHSEDFVIIGVAVLIQCQDVTDGHTDGQTPRRWLRRAKHYTLSRVKTMQRTVFTKNVINCGLGQILLSGKISATFDFIVLCNLADQLLCCISQWRKVVKFRYAMRLVDGRSTTNRSLVECDFECLSYS